MTKEQTRKVVERLHKNNPEYSFDDIGAIVNTAIFYLENPTAKAVYIQSLNRILEEKGIKYTGNKLQFPFAETNIYPFDMPQEEIEIDDLFELSGLTQKEIFVVALYHGLSTPNALGGVYKDKMDNIEPQYHLKQLTYQEISLLSEETPYKVKRLKKEAINKIQKLVQKYEL